MTAEKTSGKDTPDNVGARDAGLTSEAVMKAAASRLQAAQGRPVVTTKSA